MATNVPVSNSDPLVELRGVSKRSGGRLASALQRITRTEAAQAVDHVDLAVAAGEVVALVGESASGTSTVGRLIAGLLAPSAGDRYFAGERVTNPRSAAARRAQLALQMLFPAPSAALDPRRRVIDIVGDAAVAHRLIGPRQRVEYVGLMLNRVGFDPLLMRAYPHQLSPGQRVRIGIARALALRPRVLVCDEPLSGVDVSAQAGLLNLLVDLRAALDLTYVFISRDLDAVRWIADRVVVMYSGRVIESAATEALFAQPNHPYTQALVACSGRAVPRKRIRAPLTGEAPSPLAPPRGCAFHPRCPVAMPRCREVTPALVEIGPGRHSACHLNDRD